MSPDEVLDELAVPAEVRKRIMDDVGHIGERARQFTH